MYIGIHTSAKKPVLLLIFVNGGNVISSKLHTLYTQKSILEPFERFYTIEF